MVVLCADPHSSVMSHVSDVVNGRSSADEPRRGETFVTRKITRAAARI